MTKAKLLLVDDEESILRTLGPVLQSQGFEVATANSVPKALEAIASAKFDVLLTDLNIGQPADGFTLVSALRRTQPQAVTIIITGYPDFETALESLRKQVDDYIVKPTSPDELLRKIEFTLQNRRPVHHPLPTKVVADVINESKQQIIQDWLTVVCADPEISAIPLSDVDRTDHLPALLSDMVQMLRSRHARTSEIRVQAARLHGRIRRKQRYTIPLVLEETRILQEMVFKAIHSDLLSADFSLLIPDLIRTSDTLQVQLRASIEAYLAEPDLSDAA